MEKLSTILSRKKEEYTGLLNVIIILLILGGIFFVTAGGFSHNSKWHIDHIKISGTGTVQEDVLRSFVLEKLEKNYFFVYSRANSYLFPKREIEQMFRDMYPRFETVIAKRVDNNSIEVVITERKPYMLWCGETPAEKDCWFVDANGFVFDRAPNFSPGVYVEVYGRLIEKNKGEPLRASLMYDKFLVLNNFSKLLEKNVARVSSVSMTTEGSEVTLYTSSEFPFLANVVIRYRDDSSPDVLLKNLLAAIPVQFPGNVALKKQLLYIDMRFGNKVIFGFEK